jgi:cysteine-S-conjugate beta-lyase
MMHYDFDELIERRETDSVKWSLYPADVIPLWVADMDFRSADPIVEALRARARHGIFGYSRPSPMLAETIQERLKRLYGWEVTEPEIVFLPGIVTGLNIAFQAFADPGDAVLAQPPVYFHFLRDPVQHGRVLQAPPLERAGDTYEIDFDRFEKAITKETRVFVLCNPHNPVGRVFTRSELERLADICLRHNLVVCSDEIHCDLVYPGHHHIPFASISPEVENRTVTLMSPSKTYNIAGLECGYAVIRNHDLRKKWREVSFGLIPGVNIMGHVAALAGLSRGQDWLDQVLAYLQGNSDFLGGYLSEKMPGIRMCKVEATYLAWLDCSGTGMIKNPSEFFLQNARVALSNGEEFGQGGHGFVRLNFACPKKRLVQALDQMRFALERADSQEPAQI